jgi:ubiquinone/menaquinone biosynthesis C-methylase UbiE
MASSSNRLRSLATLARATRPLLGRWRNRLPFRRRLAPRDAYRLWSETYDLQRANPVLALEHQIWTGLLSKAEVADKVVIDIGVGTGRHWSDLVSHGPRELYGVDISREMLDRLRARFPDAAVHERTSTKLDAFPERSVDLIVSSLMLGHVREVGRELREWTRLLRNGGEIVYTDFHPEALRAGARRTFGFRGRIFEVESHCHALDTLHSLFRSLRWEITDFQEMEYDGTRLVLGFRLRKHGR